MGGTKGDSVTITCPAHQHYCEREQKCTAAIEADCLPINKWCEKKPNGLKFEATKCYEYYECWNNKITLQTCPYNQHFHKDKRMCVAGSCANEDGTTTERLPKCTIDTEGKKMPHSKCYKYYVCLNGIIYTGQCGAGYYFNEESKTCVKDIYDVCNDE
ncbi:peritrophin-44 [Stomoxys calcitrans]|uniref:peritrophin-44 n=1 Tax=Stomoxys calcitrans TaxID=35570 RepID=UPI0027E2A559|nr:peritrophin-44 [Stomoxys calcitrans]